MLHFFRTMALTIVVIVGASAQTIRGYVRDENKQPLVGATVQITGTNKVTVTDERGFFSFGKIEQPVTLVATFVGYEPQQKVISAAEQLAEFEMKESYILTDEVVIRSTRADENSPTTYQTINKQTLEKQNFGQDLPFVLNWTPSLVSTADAGAGIGYTGVRIRGSDATRINVTINGIPYNDSESQGTFWVNLPDFTSSVQSVQVQRGVGTSTNGGSAFGASINLQTDARNEKAHAELVNSFGSFGTRRHTVGFGTGLIKEKFSLDGRLSQIVSDGFIDRASSDLRSYYFSGGYFSGNTIIRALAFGGTERTYQSWFGVPESRLNNDVDAMEQTVSNEEWNEEQRQNLLNSDSRTFNPYTYENQVDDYAQYHHQLHVSHRFADFLTGNVSLHYTRGKGFYEEYRYDDDFAKYGLGPVDVNGPVESSDIIRRRWLDNHFYGGTYTLAYDKDSWNVVLGGAWNRYVCDHFGQILWSDVPNAPAGYQYYFNIGDKHDFTSYVKANYQVNKRLNLFADLQGRGVSYNTSGKENKQNTFSIDKSFVFFNPKAGFTLTHSDGKQLYGSIAVANREPVRDDFVDNLGSTPKHETLYNTELGYRITTSKATFNVNYYLMSYRNQLVLTGALNDVGANIRTNVGSSYRTGIELEANIMLSEKLKWAPNLTLSQNKISTFTEVIYDYGAGWDEYNEVRNVFSNTDISFSPNVIAGSVLSYFPIANAEISLLSKYVGKQYLDNTSNESRSIDGYAIQDVRLSYSLRPSFMKEITISVVVNNILNKEYQSNGYTWGYLGGGDAYRENYYYPQAGTNFLAMVAFKF